MHSALNCKFGNTYVTLTKEKLDELEWVYKELKVIIIDEMSMVSSNNLYDIHKRLTTIARDDTKIFGGKAVVLLGDLMQLKPVMGRPIFSMPKCKQMQREAIYFHPKLSIWQNLEVVCLEVNYRQGQGTHWLHLLNRARLAQSFDDLTEEDKELLKGRKVKTEVYWKFKENTIHVFYTKAEVEDHNNALLGRQKGKMHESTAEIKCIPASYKYSVDACGAVDSTNFLYKLKIKVGVRVMMIYNVSTTDGLINGALGTVIDILTNEESKAIQTIIIKFDNPKAGREQRETYNSIASQYKEENGTPVFRTKLQYFPEGKSKKQHANKVVIWQFPLRIAYASTAHKMQGVTTKEGTDLVCHGHKKLPKGMGYVMASRVPCYENLHLSKSFDIEKSFIADQVSLAEKQVLDERSIVPAKRNEKLDIFYVNIANLSAHFKDLKGDFTAMKARYIALVETWLEPNPPRKGKNSEQGFNGNFQLPGYSLLHTASVGAGKGCCFYSKFSDSENVTLVHKVTSEKFQFISVYLSSEKLQLTIIYLSNQCQKSDFNELTNQLRSCLDTRTDQLIMGDFNFHDGEINALSRFFNEQGLIQKVKRPTRISGRIIDHVYTNRDNLLRTDEIEKNIENEKSDNETKEKPMLGNEPISVKNVYYSDHSSIIIKFPDAE